ncbi:MAG TPA: transglutaminase domain-containing protein, partial [Myxococcales bacterium]|nr:transglutaminase domain-containing protein [Myxococcales bacterium]
MVRPALVLLLAAAAAGTAPVSDAVRAPRPSGGEYFGLYILGKKVGYQYTTLTFAPGSRDKVQLVESAVLRANVGGRNVERATSEVRTYEARPGGKLLSFKIEQHGDGGDQVLEGTATANGVTVIRRRPGLPNEIRTLKPSRETVEDADQVRVALLQKKTISGIVLNSEDLEQYRM